jgi:hypothetical protein
VYLYTTASCGKKGMREDKLREKKSFNQIFYLCMKKLALYWHISLHISHACNIREASHKLCEFSSRM